LQVGQLLQDLERQHVHPDAEELAELDQHAAVADRQPAVAPGHLSPARQRSAAHLRTDQRQVAGDQVPPDERQKRAREEGRHAQIARPISTERGRCIRSASHLLQDSEFAINERINRCHEDGPARP